MEVTTRLAPVLRPVVGTFQFMRRWPVLPLVLLALLLVTAAFAPLMAPHDPTVQELKDRNTPPIWYAEGSGQYALGTDHLGRDLLSRIVYGARISLLVMGVALVTGCIIGSVLGLVAGYFGGYLDELIMRLVDIWMAIPFILVAMIVAIVMGPSVKLIMGLLALMTWTGFVRNVRAEVLSLKQRDYVALASVAGASTARIISRHILPGVINTITVIATLRVGQLIMAEATLSFLGVGIPAPTPAWGLMVAEGRAYVRSAWWMTFFPGLAILLVVTSLNFMGDWLRDRLDPRLRQL